MEDRQQSGSKRRNELLFKVSDLINSKELQVSEVVNQPACQGNGGKNRKNQTKSQ